MKFPTSSQIRAKLIDSGVRSLKPSYPAVNAENIMTDYIYRTFFKVLLEEALAQAKPSRNSKTLCPIVEGMLTEIEALDKKEKKNKK